ncbi:MAG: thioredoxin family protein [Kiloniellaceae bacterium]
MDHPVVSRAEWLKARSLHLEAEKALTRQRDKLFEARRALPWVRVEKDYVFEGPGGPVSLGDLFDGRNQLFVQHFMLGPDWKEGCPGCSFQADHVDAARQHFEHADLSFAAVARAPYEKIAAFKRRMGWTFPWVSSFGNDFNYDYHVSFRADELERGEAVYNYRTIDPGIDELPGLSVFYRDDGGTIYHTYSSYARGGEELTGAFNFLDMVPKGRNEPDSIMQWVRHHDRYDERAPAACHSAAE